MQARERRAPRSKISLGGRGVKFDMPPAMADLAVRVAKTLDLDIAGVDILFGRDGYRICEANSSPGFQGLEKAFQVSVPDIVFAAMRTKLGPPAKSRRTSGWLRSLCREYVGRGRAMRGQSQTRKAA